MFIIKTLKNYKISVDFFLTGEKKIIFPNKMFAIYPDENNEPKKVHYFSVQEASEKTGFPPEGIKKALQSFTGRYFSQKDKKVFWVREMGSGKGFVRIDHEEFPDVNSIMNKFGMTRDDVIYQLCNNKENIFYPPDSSFLSMQAKTALIKLINAREKAKKLENALSFLPPSHIQEKAKELLDDIEKLF